MEWEFYSAWSHPGVRHLFTLRDPVAHDQIGPQLRPTLLAAGFPADLLVAAEQPHGNKVAVVRDRALRFYPGVDSLVTRLPGLPIVIRVADCGPIFFYDPINRAIGLAHSGRKGTALNILAETVRSMQTAYGTKPQQLSLYLGPCIRPPHYEVDFAAEIGRQAQALGIVDYCDSGLCTATSLDRYYSYRMEKGQTGRMWAVLMLEHLR